MAGSRTLKLSILADVDQLKKSLDTGSKEVEGFGGKLEKFSKVAAAAFAAAAAAAAAYAGKLLIDGVKAAIEDAAAQDRLANSLRNVTKATDEQIAAVEDQITQLSLAFGVADDQLRPAFQRLATATGDLTSANQSLRLALDISAATGKSVEQVSNALAKAYEGNTGALGRLGVGLSTAEIKSMGLQGTMNELARIFAGAATANANTLEVQIERLKIAFDEAKESVGARLLPIITSLLNYFINVAIPKFIEFKDRALAPVTRAIEDNKDELRLLVEFAQKYVIPVIIDGFGKAFGFLAKVVGGLLDVIGAVVRGIKSAVDFAIDGINGAIRAYNAVPFLPNANEIKKPSFNLPSTSTLPKIPSIGAAPTTPSVPSTVNVPSGAGGGATSSGSSSGSKSGGTSSGKSTSSAPAATTPLFVSPIPNARLGAEGDYLDANTGKVIINISGAVDPYSTARQIADILGTEAAVSGSFTNLGSSRFVRAEL